MAPFDPYHKWLGIPPQEQPAHHYRLLGITDFESDRDVISAAAEQRTVYLRMLQAGEHELLVAQLLNEVSQARVTLLNADQKAEYDEGLRELQAPEPEAEPAAAPTAVMQTPAPSPVVVREPVIQEFPVSVVQPAKRPRRRKPKEIWKRPAVIGVSVVGGIGVFVLLISLMFSGDADPVASNTADLISADMAATDQATADEMAVEIAAALAKGDWKAILSLDPTNSVPIRFKIGNPQQSIVMRRLFLQRNAKPFVIRVKVRHALR